MIFFIIKMATDETIGLFVSNLSAQNTSAEPIAEVKCICTAFNIHPIAELVRAIIIIKKNDITLQNHWDSAKPHYAIEIHIATVGITHLIISVNENSILVIKL